MNAPILPAAPTAPGVAPVSDCNYSKAPTAVGEEGESASFDSLLSGEEQESTDLASDEEGLPTGSPDPSLLVTPLPWMQMAPPPAQPISLEGETDPEAIGDCTEAVEDCDYSGEADLPVSYPFAFQRPVTHETHVAGTPHLTHARALQATQYTEDPAAVESLDYASAYDLPIDEVYGEETVAYGLPVAAEGVEEIVDAPATSWSAPKTVPTTPANPAPAVSTVPTTVAHEVAKISQEVSAEAPVTVTSANLLRPANTPRKPDQHKASQATEEVGTGAAKGQNSMTTSVTNTSIEEAARPASRGQGQSHQWLGQETENQAPTTEFAPANHFGGQVSFERSFISRPEHTAAQKVADTTPVFQAIHEASEKLKITGSNRMEIEVKLGTDEAVKVRLEMRDGQLHTTFQTNSTELREKLQQGWTDFSLQSLDRGMKVANANFESFSSNKDHQNQSQGSAFTFNQNAQGQSRRELGEASTEGFHLGGSRKGSSNGSAPVTGPGTRSTQSGETASGLSVWA